MLGESFCIFFIFYNVSHIGTELGNRTRYNRGYLTVSQQRCTVKSED